MTRAPVRTLAALACLATSLAACAHSDGAPAVDPLAPGFRVTLPPAPEGVAACLQRAFPEIPDRALARSDIVRIIGQAKVQDRAKTACGPARARLDRGRARRLRQALTVAGRSSLGSRSSRPSRTGPTTFAATGQPGGQGDTMTEALPTAAGDPEVVLAAIAKAAARLAVQDTGRRAEPPDEAAVEEICERVVTEAFKQFGVDLTSVASVEDFREALAHLRRSRKWWDKAGASVVTAIMSTLAVGLLAAVAKYLSLGGAK